MSSRTEFERQEDFLHRVNEFREDYRSQWTSFTGSRSGVLVEEIQQLVAFTEKIKETSIQQGLKVKHARALAESASGDAIRKSIRFNTVRSIIMSRRAAQMRESSENEMQGDLTNFIEAQIRRS